MGSNQENKTLVLAYFSEMASATPATVGSVLKNYTTDDYEWLGMHPFNEQQGADAVAEVFWKPFIRSWAPIQRRQDIFMGGINEISGDAWVTSMGHFLGLFDRDWLGIPATRKIAMLRYAEFNCLRGGKICKTALFVDIPDVMNQAGVYPFPPQTAASLTIPGPLTHDGLMFDEQAPAATRKTLDLVNQMRMDLNSHDDSFQSDQDELLKTWHEDMLWFGPAGIGSAYTTGRYNEQHQSPFSDNLGDVVFNGHVCRYAEGHYAGWFGWPNLTMTPKGGFLGLPGSDRRVDMRVVDMYRRQGDRLAENWIFIDLLYFLYQQGLDVLDRTKFILNHG